MVPAAVRSTSPGLASLTDIVISAQNRAYGGREDFTKPNTCHRIERENNKPKSAEKLDAAAGKTPPSYFHKTAHAGWR
jgi:hypothetical protein